MDEHRTDPAPAAPSTMEILRWCTQYADQILVMDAHRPCRLCDLPDEALAMYLTRFILERRLPHRVLRAEEVDRRVQ